jgi:putative transposase
MIDGTQPRLSIRRQCELLAVSRSGLYYEPEPTDPEQLATMRRIDEIHRVLAASVRESKNRAG